MTQTKRRLLITRRFPLADVGPGWENTYIDYLPMSIEDLAQLREIRDDIGEVEALRMITAGIRKRFVRGVVVVINDAGGSNETAMVEEDIDTLPVDVQKSIFVAMQGIEADPKGTGGAPSPEAPPTPNGD